MNKKNDSVSLYRDWLQKGITFMKETYIIEDIEQLKCISDPLRVKIIHLTGLEPLTSQMLSSKLNIPRPKVHYHLKELEKQGLIQAVKTEQVRNFIQIYYQPVAQSIIASPDLLLKESDDSKSFLEPILMEIEEGKIDVFSEELKKICKKYKSSKNNTFKFNILFKSI